MPDRHWDWNAEDLEKHYGVTISEPIVGRKTVSLRICGPDREKVEETIAMLQHETETVCIEQEVAGHVLGKGLCNLLDVKHKSGLAFIDFISSRRIVVMRGVREALDSAKVLLETHVSHAHQWRDVKGDLRRVRDEFRRLHKKGGRTKTSGPHLPGRGLRPEVSNDDSAASWSNSSRRIPALKDVAMPG